MMPELSQTTIQKPKSVIFSSPEPNIAVMTGATGGLGSRVCRYLLENGWTVYAACRNRAKGEKFRAEMEAAGTGKAAGRLVLLPADLTSLSSVDCFSQAVISALAPLRQKRGTGNEKPERKKAPCTLSLGKRANGDNIQTVKDASEPSSNAAPGHVPEGPPSPRLRLLINNAGIIAPAFGITEDGYETSLQVNYLAPLLLIRNLLPYLHPREGKILNTVSCTIRAAEPDSYTGAWLRAVNPADWQALKLSGQKLEEQKKHFRNLKNYGQSKLLLAVYTARLHRTLRRQGSRVRVFGADPGVVNTDIITLHRWFDPLADLFFRPFIKSPRQGAVPLIRAVESARYPDSSLLFKGKKETLFPARILELANDGHAGD